MFFSSKKKIEDIIIENLARSPGMSGPELLLQLQNIRSKTTKQALYAALRFLLQEEIVVKIKSEFSLTRHWVEKMSSLFSSTKQHIEKDPVFQLQQGESIKYTFSNFLMCDRYWTHIFDIFTRWVPQNKPVCIWNPHEWLVIGREITEKYIFDLFSFQKKQVFFSVGGNTPLDLDFKRNYRNQYVRINTGLSLGFRDNYYVNIFDDFIIEVVVDEKLADEIDSFYKAEQETSAKSVSFFHKIMHQSYPVKMKISRNQKKAEVLRKKILKDFFV